MTNDELREALQCCIEDRCETCILCGNIDCVGVLKSIFEKVLEARRMEKMLTKIEAEEEFIGLSEDYLEGLLSLCPHLDVMEETDWLLAARWLIEHFGKSEQLTSSDEER